LHSLKALLCLGISWVYHPEPGRATPSAKIFFKDGREKEVDINQLKDYVTELTVEAKKTSQEVKEAVIYYPSHYCVNKVDIIDTPGLALIIVSATQTKQAWFQGIRSPCGTRLSSSIVRVNHQ
jgi:hypothetical protein